MAWRYLRENKADWGPQHVLCVDTESRRARSADGVDRSEEKLRLGVAKYCRLRSGRKLRSGTFAFRTGPEFWEWCEGKAQPREVLWVFAHSLGFDSRQLDLWGELDRGRFTRRVKRRRSAETKSGQRRSEWKTGALVTSDPPTIVEVWTKAGGLIRCIDSLNYFATALKNIGAWVGLDKLPMPDPWEPDQTWLEYCHRDVEILEAAILKYIAWCREHQLGMFAYTLPSQAMHAYRHMSHARKIVIHDETEVKKLEGESYYGGEVYCGYVGSVRPNVQNGHFQFSEHGDTISLPKYQQIHQLDSNSLFPAVMRENLYPCRLLEWNLPDVASRSAVADLDGDCIAECLVDSGPPGIYSRRAGRSGRYTGNMVAVLAGPELRAALASSLVLAVRRYARYELADLFRGWVEQWWQRRFMAKLAGCSFEYQLCKNIMNSLYGKFAQRSYEWTDLPDQSPPMRWGNWFDVAADTGDCVHYRAIAGTTQRQTLKGFHSNACPAISAFVTSYARQHMLRLREIAGPREVYYQGVDSLYVSDLGLERLELAGMVDEAALGKLRIEASEYTADFLGWGLYRIGQRWCRTSIGRGAIEVQPGEYTQDNFERLASALSRTPEASVVVTHQRRCLSAANPVGIIGQDGWVSPLPARWGDNPAETTDPRGFYGDLLGDRPESLAQAR